jgi:hypothetical protein
LVAPADAANGSVALDSGIDVWHWLIAGIILLGIEIVMPGVVFLWLSLAAFLTAAIVFASAVASGINLGEALVHGVLSWQSQIAVFAVLAVTCTAAGRMWVRRHPVPTDHPDLNRRGSQYVGRRFVLDQPIRHGSGRLKVDDSVWKVAGDDLPAGAEVVVTGVDGVTLCVAAAPRSQRGGNDVPNPS